MVLALGNDVVGRGHELPAGERYRKILGPEMTCLELLGY